MNKTIKRLISLFLPMKKIVVVAAIAALVQVIFTLIIPIYSGKAVDLIISAHQVDFAGIRHYAVYIIAFSFIVVIGQWVLVRCTNTLSYSLAESLREQMMDTITHMPMIAVDSQPQGDFISRMISDVDAISDGLIQGFPQLFNGILTIVGTLGFMFVISPSITLIVLIGTPVSMIVAQVIAKASYRRFRQQSRLRAEQTTYVNEFISNPLVMRNFAYQATSQVEFDDINMRLYTVGQKAQFYSSLTNPSTRLINNVLYSIVGMFGAISVMNNHLSVGELSAFLTYANQYMKPFNEISGVVTELQSALASAGRVFDLIDEPRSVPDRPDAKVLNKVEGALQLKDVQFSYVPGTTFIDGFNLTVEPGQTIAIVGPTGCGKTTLINLLMRFYLIDGGEILIDHQDYREFTKQSVRQSFGMVLQDSWLFEGTIAENIAYGKPSASLEEISAVARQAHLHETIMRLKDGYQTMLQESSDLLSQGQKQLMCLARMMLIDPPMLILDEATSNIDTRTEIAIQKTFDELMKGRTSLIIAHRLSTIQNADLIVVMRQGKIVEMGRHQALLDRQGFYAHLYNSQFSGQENL